ncbi:CLUMA_CG004235, isoform A [Clunio marinus]|uniref:CLUMA_CG004235, isoform A n=1 Tax=Clunio marinus TaxID=568069 RepID=A0A1J1HRD2_9DIPT|nr:CLUMA_CG004235, isoform A [Clunio marinus]
MIAMDTKTEIQNHHSTPTSGNNGNQQSSSHQQTNSSQLCAGCGKHIQDRFLLRALDLLWHEDCLKCGCCDCRLGEVGSTLYTKGNLMLCKRDYLRLFGNTGFCAACNKVIPAFEMVMRARSNVYHLECFACQQCNHRFCVGDKFYLCDNKILCEYDYEERLVFASMANHPILKRHASGSLPGTPPNSIPTSVSSPISQNGHHHGMMQTISSPRSQNNDMNNNQNGLNGVSSPFGTPTHMKQVITTN